MTPKVLCASLPIYATILSFLCISPPSAPTTLISNGGIGKSGEGQETKNQPAPQTYMLPTDTTVLGDFWDANNQYANNVNLVVC